MSKTAKKEVEAPKPEKQASTKKPSKPFTIIGESYFEDGTLKFKETRIE